MRAPRDETCEMVRLCALNAGCSSRRSCSLCVISRAGWRLPVDWAAAGWLLVSGLGRPARRQPPIAAIAPSPTGRAEMDLGLFMTQKHGFRGQGWAVEIGGRLADSASSLTP